jgi:hypothetical protein
MRRSLLVGALLIGASSMSSAAEVHIDEHTLCLEALRAFDEKDLPTIEEFLRFVQGVFDELNAVPESGRNCAHSKTDDRVPLSGVAGGGAPRSPARAGQVSWR